MQQPKTARAWTFTSFKPEINIDRDKVKYAIYQMETTPTTNRDHWQGYFIAKSPCRLTGAQKIVGDDVASMQIANGTPEQNRKYCSKTGTEPEYAGKGGRKEGTEFVEIGTLDTVGQGKR